MSGWMAAAVVGSAALGAYSSNKAAKTQADAARQAGDVQREIFERQVELGKPYREAGETALNKLIPLATEYTPFGMQQFQADPGYGFRMSEGMKALERSAAARGGLLSGQTLKGINRFGQDMGSQEYQNAFNRYQVERNARLNPLQSLMGAGQTATNQLSGAAGQLGAGTGAGLRQHGAGAGVGLRRHGAGGDGRDAGHQQRGAGLLQQPVHEQHDAVA